MQHKLKNNKGFTIIEIMIVLAIAGLIMLIVFLAVPALQRSSRNTQRKNDVGNFSSAISTWTSNNNGAIPGMETGTYNSTTCQSDLGINTSNPSPSSVFKSVKLGYYTQNEIYCTPISAGSTLSESSVDKLDYVPGAVCSGNSAVVGNSRSYVLLYAVETGGGTQSQCTGS